MKHLWMIPALLLGACTTLFSRLATQECKLEGSFCADENTLVLCDDVGDFERHLPCGENAFCTLDEEGDAFCASEQNASCGDGAIFDDLDEECDDANNDPGDGCDQDCHVEFGFFCDGEPSFCESFCGDGELASTEECDDANNDDNDGCDASCVREFCGDGLTNNGEDCDDANNDDNDGCDASCLFEFCGDGVIQNNEDCDDANFDDGDGCATACFVEPGFSCIGVPSVCSFCGDGIQEGPEACDDGNFTAGDGCAPNCTVE